MNKNKTRAHPISDDKDQSIVPDGYKRTDTGIIPENWDEVRVGDIAKVKGGKRLPSGFVLVDTPTPHPYVRVKDMYPGGVNQSEIKYVPEQAFPAIQNYRIYSEDVFISVAGSLGIVGVVPPQLSGANLTENADYITDLKCDRDYLKYYLMSEPIQKVIQLIRTTGAQPKLALGRIAKFVISIPQDINEQRAIAEVLLDVDGLIAALEALIAKKRAIKQATMQQLLTGKTRLPGFSGAWETKRVSEFGDVVTGETPNIRNKDFWDGAYPWITPTDITSDRDMTVSERMLTQEGLNSIRRTLPPNTVLVTCIASIGKNAILKTTGSCNQQINAVVPNAAHNVEFLYYLFEYNSSYLLANAGVTATPIISKSIFSEFVFQVPSLEEQRSIASILSDIDAEIAALEQRRDKTRAIKQGMMQQLLTGRVRLFKSKNVNKT